MGELPIGEATFVLDPATFDEAFTAVKAGNFQVMQYGAMVNISGSWPGGGTKTVYDASIHGEPFALALPNSTDDSRTALAKWQTALSEPSATDRMRELGFLVNPVCDVMPIDINGVPFSAIRMTRYQDLPMHVRDGKNRDYSQEESDLFAGDLSRETFIQRTRGVHNDLVALIRNGVRLDYYGDSIDSMNICVVEGQMRLFFNDLAKTQFEPMVSEQGDDYARFYAKIAVRKIIESMSENEYQRNVTFVNKQLGPQGRGREEFIDLVVNELGQAA